MSIYSGIVDLLQLHQINEMKLIESHFQSVIYVAVGDA